MPTSRTTLRDRVFALVLAALMAAPLSILSMPTPARAASPGPYALQFSGSNQYVTFGPAPGLGAPSFTLETWFNWTGGGTPTSTGTGGVSGIPLVTKGRAEADNSNVDCNYFLGIEGGKLAADFEEGAGQASPGLNHPVRGNTTITTGAWHHAAATYDAAVGTWTLYLDGTPDGTLTLGANHAPRSDSIQHAGLATAMDSTGAAAGFFAGVMDEARIWNYARSIAQIQAARNLELTTAFGLIGHWSMNEGSGTTIADSTSPAESGTLTGGPIFVTGQTLSADAAPVVEAGPGQTLNPPSFPASASLSGSATDDGLPYPPAALTTAWSKVSGPGSVTFADASALGTTATFSAAGVYVLRLTADDSAISAADELTVTVNPDASPPAAPLSLGASVDSSGVHLSWAANGEPDLAGYNVYRSTTGPVDRLTASKLNANPLTSPAYSDGSVVNGTTYHYAVTAIDTFGNESGLSAEVGATPDVPPPGAHALDLGGSGAYVTMGDPAKLHLATFTIETWFKRTGAGVSGTTGSDGIANFIPLVTHGGPESDGSNVDEDWLLGIDDASDVLAADFEEYGTTKPPAGANHPVRGTTVITSNVWHHAAASYDGSTWRLYLDGRLEATQYVGKQPRYDSIQKVGLGVSLDSNGAPASTARFAGLLDEVRIWDHARSQAEVQSSLDSELTAGDGLVARYGMGEGYGTSVGDSLVPAADGTITGAGAAWVDGNAPFNVAPDPAPTAPTGLVATAGTGEVLLAWSANPESRILGYNVYRSTTSPVSIGSPLNGGLLTNPSFTDTSAVPGTTYHYAVSAIDSWGNESALSDEASASARFPNRPPAAPTSPSPADGATRITTSPTVSVDVSDPDGDPLTTTFYGRVAGSAAPDFTLVVLPDTQYYSASYPATFSAQTQWALDSRTSLNTVFLTHLGDIVDSTTTATQWDNAKTAIGLLDPAGLPYGLVQGNHDGAAGFDAHFPLADYTGKSWFGGSMPTKGFRDSYETFEVGNLKFLVLHLEYDGDASVIGWADGVIKANADRRVIISTHDYATPGTPAAGRSPWGDATWTSLIAPNCNVFLVLNGHAAGEAARSDLNNCGQPVEQVVQDYQSRNGNGDGWLRYYTFRPSLDIVEAHTYKVPQAGNPGVFETDADSAFSFGYAMGGSGAFSLLGTISSASGTRASIDWPGLADGATFDWYASVSDGTTSTIGPTWSFSTVAGAPTTTVVTSSQNPSVYSEAVTFQADVTSGSGEPTGNVQFSIDGQPYEAPVALDHGTASVIASGLAIGHHIVSADYLGAGGFVPSTGDLAGGQEVAKAASAVTFDAIDPSTYGQPLTVSVNVDAALPDRGVMAPMLLSPLLLTATAPDQPTGTVQFSVDGVAVGDPVPLTDGYADQTVTDLSAGSHTIRAAYSGDDNYAGSDASETASVAKATQSITFTSSAPTGAVIGGSYAPTATASSGLTPDISLAPASAAICSLDLQGTVHFDAAGTCTIRADQAGDANHEAASQVHQDVTVGKKAQSIDFGPLGPGTFGDAPFSVSASASSSLDVAFASLTGSVCTVAGSTVTIVAAGTCTIRASQAGDATWAPATPVDQGFTVAKATQSITFPALPSHTYGDAPFDVTATATSGLVVTFSTTTPAVCGVTAGGRATIVGTGTCLITASQDGDGNWLPGTPVMQGFSVNRASARTTVTSSHNPSTYGDSVTFTATVTSSAGTPSGTVTFKEGSTILATVTLNGSGQATYTTSALSVGSHTISATYAASTDYAASTGAITQTVKKVKRR